MERRPHTDEMLRTFIAVPLGAAVRSLAEEWIRVLRERPGGDAVRWVRSENLHMTLRFLGTIARRVVPDLATSVREEMAALAPFRAEVGEVRTFPSARRPRVVVLDVGPRRVRGGPEDTAGDETPAGLVHIAIAQASGTHAEHFIFPLDRLRHRQLTAQTAIDWVRRALLGIPINEAGFIRR